MLDHSKLNVFISYSRDDLEFSDQLQMALDLTGFGTSIDRHGILGGEDWKTRLGNLIRDADTIVFVLSPSSARSEICAWEVEEAVSLGKRIVPVVCRSLEDVTPPRQLADLNYIYFYDNEALPGSGFGSGMVRLVSALNTDLDWLREHTRYLRRATEWETGGRPANRLLSGSDVVTAKTWVATRPPNAPEPTALHLDFILASEEEAAYRQSAEAQRLEQVAAAQTAREAALVEKEAAQMRESAQAKRVVRRTVAGLVVATVLAVFASGFGLYALQQKNQAERNFELAQKTADRILFDVAGGLADTGTRTATIVKILEAVKHSFGDLSDADPNNTLIASRLSRTNAAFGRALQTRGDLPAALNAFKASLAIMNQLANANPKNLEWQSELSIAHGDVGDVLFAQGDLEGALKSDRTALEISVRLASLDPDNTRWQRDLSITHRAVGRVLLAQGDLEGALKSYETGLEISKRLAGLDPDNASLQDDLATTYVHIGNLRHAQDNWQAAMDAYTVSLGISDRLGKLKPEDEGRQYALGIAYNRIGIMHRIQGNLNAALRAFEQFRAISRKLSDRVPDNAVRKRELGVAQTNVGDVYLLQQKFTQAEALLVESHQTAKVLSDQDPTNVGWQVDLAATLFTLAVLDVAARSEQATAVSSLYGRLLNEQYSSSKIDTRARAEVAARLFQLARAAEPAKAKLQQAQRIIDLLETEQRLEHEGKQLKQVIAGALKSLQTVSR